MGWALFACFGCTKKRKRPKPASNFGSKNRRKIRGYEQLQSDNPEELDVSKPLGNPREQLKDETKARIRKRVRFNLEVVTYEPLVSKDDEHEIWEGGGNKETHEAAAGAIESCLIYAPLSKTNSIHTKLPLYPSNHRYKSYDGEDEYACEEVDDNECQISDDEDECEDEDEDEDEDGCVIDTQNIYYGKGAEEFRDCSSVPLISSAANARLRSHYIVPVLNPIENISQWKSVKTRKC